MWRRRESRGLCFQVLESATGLNLYDFLLLACSVTMSVALASVLAEIVRRGKDSYAQVRHKTCRKQFLN